MNDLSDPRRERLQTLLAQQAVEPLDASELEELQQLLEEFSEENPEAYELAAAAFDQAMTSPARHPMPATLKEQILRDAQKHLPPPSGPIASGDAFAARGAAPRSAPRDLPRSSEQEFRRGAADPWRWTGWLAAIAAGIALVAIYLRGEPQSPQALPLAEQRESLLEQEGTVRVAWSPGPQPFEEPVRGDVVWNQARQEGFMTFEGMPPNDPAVEQYQLWIIDPARDQYPIDGGVFDVDTDGRAVVPITPKLRTLDPQAFAVTIEKPGGVVVSEQSRLPLLAPLAEP